MPNKRQAKAGFAIVEVLVATVVLSIGFLELARAFRNINSVANQAVAMTKASNLANATMERVMAQEFDATGNQAGGYALQFDGIDDYILLPEAIDIGSTSSTISMWVRVPVVGEGNLIAEERVGVLLGNHNQSPNSNWEIHDDGQIRIYWNNSEKNLYGSSDLRDGNWHHLSFVRDVENNLLKGYVDGVAEIDENDDGTNITFSDAFYIGSDYRQGGASKKPFHGLIDELQIWDIARTQADIIKDYKTGITNPYSNSNLKLYLRMNNGMGTTVFDHSSNMVHSPITSATWTDESSSWSTTLGTEGEASWSEYDDVDDFHTVSFKDSDYTGLDAGSNNFSGLGGRIYVKYISLNGGSGTSEDPYTFNDSGTPTDYKQITVKVGIPGTTDSTQIDAIKSAKVDQGYGLTFSPYGL
jgi:hypothetical protein